MAGAALEPVAVRIQFPVLKSVREANGDYIVEGIASDEGLDLESEVVKAAGWLKHIDYLVNQGKITWDHQPGLILGEVLHAEVKTPEWVQKHFGFQPTGRALYLKARIVAPNDEMETDQRKALQVCRGLLESGVQLGLSMEGARVRSLPAQIGGREAVQTLEVVPTGCSITPSPVNPRGVCRLAKSLSEAVSQDPEEGQGPAVLVCKGVPDGLLPRGGGRGQGGPPQGDGGSDVCYCPECGETLPHERGKPCTEQTCPKCGATLQGADLRGEDVAKGVREIVAVVKAAMVPTRPETEVGTMQEEGITGSDLARHVSDFVTVVKAMLTTGYGTDSAQLRGGAALRRSGLGRRKVRKARKRDRYEEARAHGAKLGSGARFRAIEEEAREGGARDPAAVAAAAGRRKYGKKRMAQMAAAGRKRKGR